MQSYTFIHMTMRIALTAWGINPCGYINIAYMPKSASGTTSTHAKELLQECHAATHILILVTRLWEWGDGLSLSMARANCTSIALMHALNRYNIYIYILYIHTFLPNAYAFLFPFTSSFMTWTFTFLVAMLAMIPASGCALQQQQRPRRHHQAYRSTTFRFSVAWLR